MRGRLLWMGMSFLLFMSAAGQVHGHGKVQAGADLGLVLEGVLPLAERARHLFAIEFDSMLAQRLRVAFASAKNVEIVEADFLKVPLEELLLSRGGQDQRAKVVGNIPYYITSDIVLRLFGQYTWIETIVLMVQKEVADRLAAEPGTRDYGLLTVTANLFADVEQLFTLPPGAFSPPPKVYSSVLRFRISPKIAELGVDAREFLNFCKLAFAHKVWRQGDPRGNPRSCG